MPIRIFSVLLCLVLLSGCAASNGTGENGTTQPPETQPASTAPEEPPAKPADPGEDGEHASTQPPEEPPPKTAPETSDPSTGEPPGTAPQEPPEQRPASQKPSGTVLISFETPILDYSKGRITNIKLAVKKLNGCVIPAGEIFSFNDTVGPRTMKRGFKKAVIFVGGEKVQELGGGICQVSSTIYNAALDAGFEIVERHPHQLEVNYVPPDRDATVFYGRLDFKFKNNSQQDLLMEAKYTGKSVVIRLVVA